MKINSPYFLVAVMLIFGALNGYADAYIIEKQQQEKMQINTLERQITTQNKGHILTNTGVWSPDSNWIVYDTRSDPAGDIFDGSTIEMVNIHTGEVKVLYHSKNNANCGVVTFHPHDNKVVFILGPENPTPDWQYSASHRQGITVDVSRPNIAINLDARDLTPPFTPGALRGGSHVHVWDAKGEWVSFTYEDHILSHFKEEISGHEINLRNIGVSAPIGKVHVKKEHPRNHDGEFFSVVVSRTTANPKPGSDEIKKAFEEGWVGTNGYLRPDGSRQKRALSFQGHVVTAKGETISEVFIVDLPEDIKLSGDAPLTGTETRRPYPPRGTIQRRLTYTSDRKYPGIQGPRHWLRSSPDGSLIAFLMKDDNGIVQLWTISPNGGEPLQITHNLWSIASAFTWSPDGRYIAHVIDNSVAMTEVATGKTIRLTPRSDVLNAPRPEACVFSPDGKKIAYIRRMPSAEKIYNQVFIVTLKD
jgi:Tol biopolymer transport system component